MSPRKKAKTAPQNYQWAELLDLARKESAPKTGVQVGRPTRSFPSKDLPLRIAESDYLLIENELLPKLIGIEKLTLSLMFSFFLNFSSHNLDGFNPPDEHPWSRMVEIYKKEIATQKASGPGRPVSPYTRRLHLMIPTDDFVMINELAEKLAKDIKYKNSLIARFVLRRAAEECSEIVPGSITTFVELADYLFQRSAKM
jgi:hypothetical protein